MSAELVIDIDAGCNISDACRAHPDVLAHWKRLAEVESQPEGTTK